MLGYSPIAGSALASSGHEIIVVSLDNGSFALSGQTIDFGISETLDNGSFSLAGQDVSVIAGKGLGVDAGSFSLTGKRVGTVISVNLSAAHGSFRRLQGKMQAA